MTTGRSRNLDTVPEFDESVDLAALIAADELDELVVGFASAHGAVIVVEDARGHRLAGSGELGPEAEPRDVLVTGELVARVRAGGERGAIAAAHLADVLGLVLHHAQARHLSAAAHEVTVYAAYQEVTAKNRRLMAAVDRLQEVDRLKSNFLATMSHELRTPLTSVIGYSEMLLEGLAGPLGGEQREYVATILAKADQLLGLITAVLDVSMLESGRGAVEPVAVPLDEIVGSVVAAFAPQAQKRAIQIGVQVEGIAVLGDRRQLRQVLWQLVSNAVKFTPDHGQIDVEIRPGPLAADGPPDSGCHLTVRDSGIGIAAEQLPHIFEPFFQVDQSSTRAFGGTGLGLALAKAYVEAQGGRIWVDSTPGLGSTFVVSLPCAPPPTGSE